MSNRRLYLTELLPGIMWTGLPSDQERQFTRFTNITPRRLAAAPTNICKACVSCERTTASKCLCPRRLDSAKTAAAAANRCETTRKWFVAPSAGIAALVKCVAGEMVLRFARRFTIRLIISPRAAKWHDVTYPDSRIAQKASCAQSAASLVFRGLKTSNTDCPRAIRLRD